MERAEFEHVTRADAEAIGPPGQRRFRLVIGNELQTVILWLEKQHLQALGAAFEQILAHLQVVQVAIPLQAEEPDPAIGAAEIEVGRLQVGYDEEREQVVLVVHSIVADEDAMPDFVGRLTPRQSGELAMQIRRVINVGARQRANGHYNRP